MINLKLGSMFDSPCDLLIIPCTNKGKIADKLLDGLKTNNYPILKEEVSFSKVLFKPVNSHTSGISVIGFAASVNANGFFSTEKAILMIARDILVYALDNNITSVNIPLLGSGAGKLSFVESFANLQIAFDEESANGITFNVCVLSKHDYEFLNNMYHKNDLEKEKNGNETKNHEIVSMNLKKAQDHVERGEYEEALSHYIGALEIASNKSPVLLEMGITYGKLGNREAEFDCYDKAIEHNPKYIQAYMQKSHVLVQDQDYEGAIKCLKNGLTCDLKPKDEAVLWHTLAVVYLGMKLYEEAIGSINRSLELHDNEHTRKIKQSIEKTMSNKGRAYGGTVNNEEQGLREEFETFLNNEKGYPYPCLSEINTDIIGKTRYYLRMSPSTEGFSAVVTLGIHQSDATVNAGLEAFGVITDELYKKSPNTKFYFVLPDLANRGEPFNITEFDWATLSQQEILWKDFPKYRGLIDSNETQINKQDFGAAFNNIPDLPALFKKQTSKIDSLRSTLLKENKSIIIAGPNNTGKTTLANELARDKKITQYFKDNIIWIPFFAIKDIKNTMIRVVQTFAKSPLQSYAQDFVIYDSISDSKKTLKKLFEGQKVLLILDACEDTEKVKAFSGIGEDVKLVVTTPSENPEEMEQMISGKVYRPEPFEGKLQVDRSSKGCGLDMNKRAGEEEICLNANDYAEVLEEVILDGQKDKEGFCFALFGHWGRGKTFLMELVEERLKRSNYETIFFSAWKYPTKPEIWVHIYETFVTRAFDFNAKGKIATTIRAGFTKKVVWPMICQILLLAYFAVPKIPMLSFINDKASILLVLFLISFVFRAKYSLTYLFKKYFTLATHKEKLGLQKTVADDLTCLLQAWVARDKCPQLSSLQKRSLFLSLLTLLLCLNFRLLNIFEIVLVSWASLTFAGANLLLLAGLCRLYFYIMKTGPWPEKVLLVIDDLDRCNVDEIVDIIGSIKLFTEEEEIRKRVQVVVLVEEDILRHALVEKYSGIINSNPKRKEGNYINRIVNENIEKLFIGHLRLSELTTEDVEQVISKVTGKHLANETIQSKPKEKRQISDKNDKSGATEKPTGISAIAKVEVQERLNTVFSLEEHSLLRKHVIKLGNAEYGVKLGPRAIRCFTMKYLVGRLICDKLKVHCTNEELIEAIVTCYTAKDAEDGRSVVLEVAKQVC